MTDTADDSTARELARLVVARTAPEELPVFAAVADASLADSARMLGTRDDVRDPLGFGAGEVAVLLTPFAVLAAQEVVTYLTTLTLDAGRSALRRWAARRHGDQDDPAAAPAPPLDLSAGQLVKLRRIVRDKALALGLPEQQADLLADAFAGSVATADGG